MVFKDVLAGINGSKLVLGIALLIMNFGAKHVGTIFTPAQEALMQRQMGAELLVFAMAFTSSRDVVLALVLTALFSIGRSHLLNESSPMCIMPHYLGQLRSSPKRVSTADVEAAKATLAAAREQGVAD